LSEELGMVVQEMSESYKLKLALEECCEELVNYYELGVQSRVVSCYRREKFREYI
jgi:hypothetical protein